MTCIGQFVHKAIERQNKKLMSPKKIFVNLPVKDLPKAKEFFGKLGFKFNAQFTDDTAACMILSENVYSMLLTHAKFKAFAPQAIADASRSTEVLVALSCESRGEVDELVAKAVTAGGSTYTKPKDYGFMYEHGFQDLDGHVWEVFYMDPSMVKPQ
jgi:predicted lactoylglutathione lyase